MTRPKRVSAIDELGHRAHATLGSWSRVAEVWGLLWSECETDAERAGVRAGHVATDRFDAAVARIADGHGVEPGPLGRVVA